MNISSKNEGEIGHIKTKTERIYCQENCTKETLNELLWAEKNIIPDGNLKLHRNEKQ